MQAKIVLASNNQGKIAELNPLLEPLQLTLIAQSQFNMPDHDETGLSFIENAIDKARWASKHTGLPAIGDDSGLVIPALKGRPGIFSRRFAGPNATDEDNIEALLSEMTNISERHAFFYCAMAYVRHCEDPIPLIGLGQFHGNILKEKRGEKGFGYDPLFLVPDLNQTAAELPQDTKNQLSHRAKASKQLIAQLKETL